MPAGHRVHELIPVKSEYLPAPHDTQSDSAPLPVVEAYLPIPQSSHELAPVAPAVVEYLPAPHATQSDAATLPWEVR